MIESISIQGNIGSGKSTLLSHLQRRLSTNKAYVFVDEPVELWNGIKDAKGTNMLTLFYQNKQKYAFAFQMMALSSRNQLIEQAKTGFQGQFVISERSLDADKHVFAKMLHQEGSLSDVEFQIYNNCYQEFVGKRANDKVVYLRTSPTTANKRVAKRARPGETIPYDYIARCHQVHEEWIRGLPHDRVLILDANNDMGTNPRLHDKWVQQIQEFISR